MHNVEDTLITAARYKARDQCQYIASDLKIRLENLNEVNNGFTWVKRFTHGLHKMAKDGILK